MRFGASTFIWVSPFSNKTLDLIDRIRDFGFDLIEICIEDPETIDVSAIRSRTGRAGIGVTVCGAFGPNWDLSSEDEVPSGRTASPTFAAASTSPTISAAPLFPAQCTRASAIRG